MISVYDVNVGDILYLEPGDSTPADGILINGDGVKCDESSVTGESDQIPKTMGHQAMVKMELISANESPKTTATEEIDPFIISGSKVLEGYGTYLGTSIGQYPSYGKIMLSLQTTPESTPLQVKLSTLADWIGILGLT